ncbi:conserved hypothetical protein [Culex quinquefasciatus]|uniref:Odorant receptor n=1 Tax=Culex quinquefasciatus TaxID=7176 RepID=B0WQG7_CULQU|nr:conserved hypothetical protein [Culex quinquefasciatus]|eukprot:XP_001850951.1 conserved hypothetical protein [Culex quinquefasciatus]
MAIIDQSVRWFRKLFSKSQAKDVFWLLDYLLILGGTYHRPRGVWRITIWYLYQLLSVFQCCLQILIVVSNLNSLQDQTSTIWSAISLLAMTLCYVKQLLLWRYRESINNLRTFITGSRFCSGNPSYDEALRSKFSRVSQQMVVAILALILLDEVFIAAPSSLRTRWFGIPQWFYSYGYGTALAIELAFYPFFALIWVSKLFCGSATVAIVLLGLRTELQILTQYYGRLTRNLQSLQVLFEKIFFLIYYQSIIAAGAISYVIIRDEFSLCSVAVLTCMSISVLECYWWCHLVDTFQDVNETISRHLLNQCCQLPYSDDHHVDYVKMRTSLLIIAGRSRQSVGFSCCGIFKISTAMFANLLNICYSVLMFLVNVGDGVKPVAQLQAWIGSN